MEPLRWSAWFLGSLVPLLVWSLVGAIRREEFAESATAREQLRFAESLVAGELPQSEASVEVVAGSRLAHQEKVPEEEAPLCVVVEW
mgnify:CR=1 FL=1